LQHARPCTQGDKHVWFIYLTALTASALLQIIPLSWKNDPINYSFRLSRHPSSDYQ